LDDFCSAYINNILIYLLGTLEDYKAKVRTVVEKLGAASLQLDIRKSEFGVKKTKYLGFIIKARKGISIDLEKVRVIRD